MSLVSRQPLEATSDDIDEVYLLHAALRTKKGDVGKGNIDICNPTEFHFKKDKTQFRQYQEAYESYNLKARNSFHSRIRVTMTVWEAIEKLNILIDNLDPYTSLSQIEHLLQTVEAIRRDDKPRWMQLTGLIHDQGKLLFFFDAERQWDIVGDTFPVGCKFDDRIIYPEAFIGNTDHDHPIYGTEYGIYTPVCGLDNVMLSWGHNEYLYHVVRNQSTLPEEALAMIGYHSFYPEKDANMLEAVNEFNPYDFYSKDDEVPKVEDLKEYYMEPINEFFSERVIKR
ncbi:DUF706-domain-containing protein [Patellaria atrata CBS 101060]|uniref:Inositol oxygenase n=1 Tax=Patellaria atrata CBS 101060 TaxID=1346257 RepID=A0A9P4S0U9_9PEZI|nr:DUF706-domain-containing protein [Patellaria atrata CBS 101060]